MEIRMGKLKFRAKQMDGYIQLSGATLAEVNEFFSANINEYWVVVAMANYIAKLEKRIEKLERRRAR
jgi:hypothetical protein